jgi:hypothetical protein
MSAAGGPTTAGLTEPQRQVNMPLWLQAPQWPGVPGKQQHWPATKPGPNP